MRRSVLGGGVLFVLACAWCCSFGDQPVVWTQSGQLDMSAGSVVTLDSTTIVPDQEMEFMRNDIQAAVRGVLKGTPEGQNVYNIKVTITKYDEGSAIARFILIGLGSMHLDGTVEVTAGSPPQVVRVGEFKKIFRVGGIIGGFAKMHESLVAKIGKTIAEALQKYLPSTTR